MNSLKVFGKYLDQPRLVSRFSRAVPPLLSLAASGIVLDSTYRAPEDKRQKSFYPQWSDNVWGSRFFSLRAENYFQNVPDCAQTSQIKRIKGV